MTREEAIKVLNGKTRTKIVNKLETREWFKFREALDMAIQALSQEPTIGQLFSCEEVEELRSKIWKQVEQEPCDDAISREEARKVISVLYGRELCEIIYQINLLPSVTQKSGEWIKIQSGDKDFPESIVCSKCGSENSHLDFNENAEPIGKVFVTSKYCPNCGARMERER